MLNHLLGLRGVLLFYMDLSAIINSVQGAITTAPIANCPSLDDKRAFQEALAGEFSKNLRRVFTDKKAMPEHRLWENSTNAIDKYNDKCDVFVETERYIIIVELDTTRADQVAKKMLSRYYYADKYAKPIVYVCLLYPGTKKMNPNECIKYMKMGKDVLLSMNSSNRFIGAFINGNDLQLKLIG